MAVGFEASRPEVVYGPREAHGAPRMKTFLLLSGWWSSFRLSVTLECDCHGELQATLYLILGEEMVPKTRGGGFRPGPRLSTVMSALQAGELV